MTLEDLRSGVSREAPALFDLSPASPSPDGPTITRAILELVGRERERHQALAQGKRRVPVLTPGAAARLLGLAESHPLVAALLTLVRQEAFVTGFGAPMTVQAAQDLSCHLRGAAFSLEDRL